MAITINQQPKAYTTAYNDIVFVATSTNTAQPNFNYIFDVWIEGVLISRHRLPARPDNGKAVFNAGRIVENYLTFDFSETLITVQKNTNSITTMFVNLYEEYGVTPTISALMAVSDTIYVWNGVLDYSDYVTYAVTDYRLMTSQTLTSKLLTNNQTQNIKLTEKSYISALIGQTDAVRDIQINAYDLSGTLLKTTKIDNPFNTLSSTDRHLLRFPAGPVNLNLIINADLDASTQNEGQIIPANTSYYTIQTLGTSASSKIMRYNIKEFCSKHTPVRLHFINKLGNFDSFTFDLASKTKNQIDRKNYRQKLGGFISTTYTNSLSDRSLINYDTQIKETLIINSNWISDAESIWLEELVCSPIIYMETTAGVESVSVTDSNYEVKQTLTDKLYNLSLTLEKSSLKHIQRA